MQTQLNTEQIEINGINERMFIEFFKIDDDLWFLPKPKTKYPSLLICKFFPSKKTFFANLFCPIIIPPWTKLPLKIVSLEKVTDVDKIIITKEIIVL